MLSKYQKKRIVKYITRDYYNNVIPVSQRDPITDDKIYLLSAEDIKAISSRTLEATILILSKLYR